MIEVLEKHVMIHSVLAQRAEEDEDPLRERDHRCAIAALQKLRRELQAGEEWTLDEPEATDVAPPLGGESPRSAISGRIRWQVRILAQVAVRTP